MSATVCGPSRACLLTGLYSQQHCLFRSSAQPLRPYNSNWLPGNNNNDAGFPAIGLEIIMRRYERASTLLTSNRPVEDWGKLLGDVAAVTAMRFWQQAT